MTTTLNSSYQSKPLTVAQGGSGLSSTTAYGLLFAGTGTTTAWQNIGTGTAGQIPASGGSSSITTWKDQDQIGAWVMIKTNTASSSASITFTGLTTTYYAYKVVISALVPQTNATNLQLLTSSNNGSSYDNGANNYTYINNTVNDSGAVASSLNGSNGATQILIGNVWSNSSFSNNIELLIVDPATSSSFNGFNWFGKYDDSTSGSVFLIGIGNRGATQVNNAFEFKMSSGTIVSGTFTLYGLLA